MTTIAGFVDAMGAYTAEQKAAIKSALVTLRQASNPAAANTDVVTQDQYNGFFTALGPQARGKPDLLFLNFTPALQDMVTGIADAFGHVDVMVASGLAGAGLSNAEQATTYELLFGKKTRTSWSSFPQRTAKVKAVLGVIRAGLAEKWVVKYDSIASDIASHSGGNTITIGTGWRPGGGKFAAGVLIHEMGHRAGLVDVCSFCLDAQLKKSHFQSGYATAGLNCAKNNEHGKSKYVKDANSGHFIGLKRSKLLPLVQKNLTIWNADSYRWYCSYFHKDDVTNTAPAAITW
ncbi:MAG: hypothetical protein HYX47_18400 [Burkholderiales bacterium]|nr:hypothetical protein [Burkholderiales bacterium]